MRHSIEWQDDAVNAAPEERATVADLRLFLNEQNVTLHMQGDKTGDHVTIALYGLVDGLVHDWWSIFGARDRVFSLRQYRTGYLLPDIRMQFDGATFEVSAHQSVYVDPDLRFWGGTAEVLSRSDAEAWLSGLIKEVLARLHGMPDTSADLRWRRIQDSRQSGESAFCEAAGSLGLDPYDIDDGVANFIEQAEAIFKPEPLVEFVSGAGDVDRVRLLAWIDRMMRATSSRYRLGSLRSIVEKVAADVPRQSGEEAWAAGYRRARGARRVLGLQQHQRFASFVQLAGLLGAGSSYELAPKVDGISALRREAPHGIDVHLRNHGDSQAAKATHLFTLARAFGDAACFPEPQTASVNRLQNAFRQSAGRAFAAEFLAPIDEIRSMRADEKDLYSIADEFGVAPLLVEHQIQNEKRIDRACA